MIGLNKKNLRILHIGDLHQPFTLKKYLDFCKYIYNKYNCNKVIFAGDILDNHFSSFHDIDPDGHSAGRELELAIREIRKYYNAFPEADVCLGNHDQIPDRKAFSSGISKRWIKGIGDILDTPGWNYSEEFIYNDVLYCHGNGRKAISRAKQDLISVAQGHFHSDSYIQYIAGKRRLNFAMQIGSGIDWKSFAMAYGRNFAKPHINVGLILDQGTLPILEYMQL